MTEQQWNFAGIEAAASAIQGNVTSIHSLLDEGKQSLTKLAAAWGGSGSEAYQGVQQKWDATATERTTRCRTWRGRSAKPVRQWLRPKATSLGCSHRATPSSRRIAKHGIGRVRPSVGLALSRVYTFERTLRGCHGGRLRQALPAARRYGSSGRYGSAAVLRPQCFVSAGARIGKPTEAQRPDSAPDVRRPVGAVRVDPAAATPTPTSASANSDADRRRRAALAGTGRI